jgi:hypothetical protein
MIEPVMMDSMEELRRARAFIDATLDELAREPGHR